MKKTLIILSLVMAVCMFGGAAVAEEGFEHAFRIIPIVPICIRSSYSVPLSRKRNAAARTSPTFSARSVSVAALAAALSPDCAAAISA